MKIFEKLNTKKYKKIIFFSIVLIIILFATHGNVQANSKGLGGKLLEPVVDLVLAFGDGVMNIIHSAIFGMHDTGVIVDMTNDFFQVLSTIAVVLIVAIAVAAVIATGGAALAAIFTSLSGIAAGTVTTFALGAGIAAGIFYNTAMLPDNLMLPVYKISPEQIFSNKVNLFDVDFFTPKEDAVLKDVNGNIQYDEAGNEIVLESTAKILRGVISTWYVILRNIAVVVLLSLLVYTGIRIIISSTAADKAKYKSWLIDWFVAICLLFVMNYIMAFSNIIVSKITTILDINNGQEIYEVGIEDKDNKIEDKLRKSGFDDGQISKIKNGDMIIWETNLLGKARMDAQMNHEKNTSYAGYTIVFLVLVFFTVFFIFTYLKRVVYMAFLTIIAPLVAMTYPLDKMNDGSAQAFNSWFKEYIFNLLIQPLHLLLYTILVTSAFELAAKNIIYSLVALGFMIPAEKLMRKFFGFEKAHTPGLLAGPAGAAATMGIMSKLLSRGGNKKSSATTGGRGAGSDGSADNNRIRDNANYDVLFGGEENAQNPPRLNTENNRNNLSDVNEALGISDDEHRFENSYNQDEMNEMYDWKTDNLRTVPDAQLPNVGNVGQETKIENENSNQKDALRQIKNSKPARAVGAGARHFTRKVGANISKQITSGELGRKTLRTVGGIAGGAALGSVGLALGVASGDLTKTAQYTGAMALGGYKGGSSFARRIQNSETLASTKEAMNMAADGKDGYKERELQKTIREMRKDYKLLEELENKVGSDKAKEISKDIMPTAAEYGLSNANELLAVYNSYERGNSVEFASARTKYEVDNAGKSRDLMTTKELKEYEASAMRRIGKRNLSDNDKQRLMNDFMTEGNAINKDLYGK